MSGYQRMVSYLYRYDQGIKGKNVGYARIETRNDKCRVTVRFQDMISVSPMLSFFMQREQGIEKLPAGKLVRSNGGFQGRIETAMSRVAGSEYSFEQMDGLYISGPDGVFYATTWKDIDITKKTELSGDAEVTQQPDPDGGSKDVQRISEKIVEAAETKKEPDRQEDYRKQTEKEEIPMSSSETKAPESAEPSQAASPDMESCARESSRPSFGERILQIFPKMYPFETEEMGECVRIDLKDLGNLPVAYWSLAGNPFLLRGYYCYRHLIFMRTGKDTYAVGVPGIYSEDNSRWAEECRMSRFQPLAKVKDRQGAFGYWLFRIRA